MRTTQPCFAKLHQEWVESGKGQRLGQYFLNTYYPNKLDSELRNMTDISNTLLKIYKDYYMDYQLA